MPDSADLIGQRIGSYEIISLLGKGGMAEVYLARQVLEGGVSREVAIKLIDPPRNLALLPEFKARFDREAQTLISLSHPHILKAFDYGLYQGNLYLVMELMTGGSLADQISHGPLSYARTIQVISQIGDALDYTHGRGIIHRDLKPLNVLLDGSGNAYLSDFGLVKLQDGATSLTRSHAVMGTPGYMSPEYISGLAIDSRSDLYSLGVMLFELLSGKLPFTGETPMQMAFKHAFELPPRLSAVLPTATAALDQVISKALAKAPADRYQRADALTADLKAALQQPTQAPPLSVVASPESPMLPPEPVSIIVEPSAHDGRTAISTISTRQKPIKPPDPNFRLPLLGWINIPPGRVTLEDTGVRYPVAPFAIARYPVTNQQFQAFITDGGYDQDRFWDGLAKRESGPEAPEWTTPTCPRETVNWYEAIAFSRWLSEKTGLKITLPTEMQWQWAAAADTGWDYPYGAAFDPNKSNTAESGIQRTTPVDQYPEGASPFGVMDMSGNVWEWCLNEYRNPTNINLTSRERRVLRGGSWSSSAGFAGVLPRGLNLPNLRLSSLGYFGFRLAINTPLS